MSTPTPTPTGFPRPGAPLLRKLVEADYLAAATSLGCEVAAIKAVAHVESAGSGWLKDGRLKVLFEAHLFSRQTGGRFIGSHPNLAAPRWDKSLYGASGGHQWDRLLAAAKLDEQAAKKSASYGMFQILGSNAGICGFKTVDEFIWTLNAGAAGNLRAFCGFVKTNGLADALRRLDFPAFAEGYNGPGYRANKYDSLMAAEYQRLIRRRA